jgi:aspartate/methionine/tyrosine aminotransferase
LRYLDWVYHVSGNGGLSLYDSSVAPPDALLAQAAARAFAQGGIPSAFGGGGMAMRQALADHYDVTIDQIVVTSGAASGLALVLRALVSGQADDHVLVEQPGYQPFEDMALAAGWRAEYFVRSGPDMRPNLADIAARLRPQTRMIILSHLHNPTGQPLLPQDRAALVALCERAGIWLVVDEIYGAFIDDRALAASHSPRVISLSGLSKIFGLGGLRCGWIVAAPALADRLRRASIHGDTGLSAVSQAIAWQVLQDWPRFCAWSQSILERNRPIMAQWLASMGAAGFLSGHLPPFGCLTFPRLVGMEQTDGFAAWLLATSGIIVAPGQYWGAPAHIRLGMGMAQGTLEHGLEGLGRALQAYAAMDTAQRRDVDCFRL